jgi:hypothetical protein
MEGKVCGTVWCLCRHVHVCFHCQIYKGIDGAVNKEKEQMNMQDNMVNRKIGIGWCRTLRINNKGKR